MFVCASDASALCKFFAQSLCATTSLQVALRKIFASTGRSQQKYRKELQTTPAFAHRPRASLQRAALADQKVEEVGSF